MALMAKVETRITSPQIKLDNEYQRARGFIEREGYGTVAYCAIADLAAYYIATGIHEQALGLRHRLVLANRQVPGDGRTDTQARQTVPKMGAKSREIHYIMELRSGTRENERSGEKELAGYGDALRSFGGIARDLRTAERDIVNGRVGALTPKTGFEELDDYNIMQAPDQVTDSEVAGRVMENVGRGLTQIVIDIGMNAKPPHK